MEAKSLDALSEIRSQDDDHIEILVDEKIASGHRSYLGLSKIRKVTYAALQQGGVGDRVAVVVVRAAKNVGKVVRAAKLGKHGYFFTRGEVQPKAEVRGRKEKTMLDKSPSKAVSYDQNNLPPLSKDARALLDRINRQAKARLANESKLQSSGKITVRRRTSIGLTSKRQKSVVSK